jgi:hypothetical protein
MRRPRAAAGLCELERWTRVGYERGMGSRHGERGGHRILLIRHENSGTSAPGIQFTTLGVAPAVTHRNSTCRGYETGPQASFTASSEITVRLAVRSAYPEDLLTDYGVALFVSRSRGI